MKYVVGKNPCIRCEKDGRDNSKDNFHWYGESLGGYCFSCGFTIPSKQYIEQNQEYNWEENKVMGLEFNKSVLADIKKEYTFIEEKYRGIRPDIYKYFGVMHKIEDGKPVEQIYPTFRGKEVVGFKRRELPKTFLMPYGDVGADVDFFSQWRWLVTESKREVIICSGEIDMLSAYQMLRDWRASSNSSKGTEYPYTPVVSSTVGELGAAAQARNNYEWLNKFDKIIICPDSDEAGRKAVDKMFGSIPKNKMYVMELPMKDANEMLLAGKSKEFIDAYFRAKPYTPAGVHASTSLYEAAYDYTNVSRLTLPPFLKKAETMFGGGLVKREMSVIFAKTSTGKSLFINAITRHWILNHPEEIVGVLSLEATIDKYATSVISDHIGVNLTRLKDGEEKRKFLSKPDIKQQIKQFFEKEDGSPRFYVCDDRGADIEIVKEKIVEMIVKMGITILVIDPYSDLMSGMENSKQEEFSSWMKKIVKEYPVSLVLVCHTRKGNGKDKRRLEEEDIIGSSTIMKSSAQTISLERDKLAESEFQRNITSVAIHKNRHSGQTGEAGEIFYEWQTGRLYDKDEYLKIHPDLASFEDRPDE